MRRELVARLKLLLALAAAFQLFDGTQAVATGVLRGVSDTRSPMMMNVIGHWALGLPAGYVLCFWSGWGVSGLWIGLSIGLIFVALALTLVWAQRTRAPRDMHAPGCRIWCDGNAS
jgi:MATE family multidrug resistance protein